MKLNNNPVLFLLKRLWKYSVGNRRMVVLYFVLFLGANTVYLLEPFFVAKILDVIQFQGVTQATLPLIVLLSSSFVGVQLAFWAFHGPARVIERKNSYLVNANFRMFLVNGVLDLPAAWHTDHHSGDTIDKIEKGSNALGNFAEGTYKLVESASRLLFTFGILLYFDIWAGLIVAVMAGVSVVIILAFDKRLIAQYRELNRMYNSVTAKVFDVISNVTTVIVLRIEKLVAKTIEGKVFQPFPLYKKNTTLNEVKWFLVAMCTGITMFFVLALYFTHHVQLGLAVSLGAVYLLYTYVQRATDVFFNFTYMYGDMVRQRSAVLNAEELSNDFRTKKDLSLLSSKANWHELAINSLSFSYHPETGADLHLEDVSIAIRRGARIAFIGESGSGKTTMLKVLRGLYEPKDVRVTLDGKPLKHGLEAMSAQIALIPQDPEIFATTIRENITMGVEHRVSTITKYTDMARFTDVVERLPHGLDSSIVEKGVNLSGGEKQRLALARGLLACADKSIVLLDEPTSSVDLQNESAIYENIFAEFKNKAIISSVHRLHLLHLFDLIYYFDEGRIIASGSLEELMRSSERFRTMWEKYQETQKNT